MDATSDTRPEPDFSARYAQRWRYPLHFGPSGLSLVLTKLSNSVAAANDSRVRFTELASRTSDLLTSYPIRQWLRSRRLTSSSSSKSGNDNIDA